LGYGFMATSKVLLSECVRDCEKGCPGNKSLRLAVEIVT
jgi:hypothetical protein